MRRLLHGDERRDDGQHAGERAGGEEIVQHRRHRIQAQNPGRGKAFAQVDEQTEHERNARVRKQGGERSRYGQIDGHRRVHIAQHGGNQNPRPGAGRTILLVKGLPVNPLARLPGLLHRFADAAAFVCHGAPPAEKNVCL